MDSSTEFMEACADLALGAGDILRERFTGPRTIVEKHHNDLVTDADRASEAWLIAEVARRFPGHAVLAEESGAHGGAGFTWVMDPLDGTTNYAHAFPHFSVSVAVCDSDGLPVAGAVADPLRGEVFLAGRGKGAWLRHGVSSRRLGVTACARLADALLATGFPYDRAFHDDNNHPEHDALSSACHGVRRPGSAALDLSYVAAGRLDGYWEAHLKPWDLAAGVLLVAEAGGVVTAYDGSPLKRGSSAVVAAGRALHGALRQAVADVRAARGFPVSPAR